MTLLEKLKKFQCDLEDEFSDNCIKVEVLFDGETRFLAVGIEHPLSEFLLVDGLILPERRYDDCLKHLYEQFVHDLNFINSKIKENYD